MNRPTSGIGAGREHAQMLVDSYKRWTGKELLPLETEGILEERLFHCPTVILSHGTESDPVLNYGNQAALQLWEMDWESFTRTPSQLTAEPMERIAREQFFEIVTSNGFVDNYTGIRISSTGRRFYIVNAIVWNIMDRKEQYRGQAAAFTEYQYC